MIEFLQKKSLFATLPVLLLALSCSQEPPQTGTAPMETAQLPIVGGTVETGWQGVGALTLYPAGYQYSGSFCTGTLLAPQWVLTAAHCLTSEGSDFDITPWDVRFYVGNNANPVEGLPPSTGQFFQADAFYVHPNYDSDDHSNDIAMMHLSEPATGVATYQLNTSNITSSWVGSDILYVGYGVTNGLTKTGDGIKRSGHMDIVTYEATLYTSEYSGQGVCFGDSGGPGLKQISGAWKVIGVNSTVGSDYGDPCTGYAFQTRVDAFATWIAGVMNTPPPDCNDNPDICYCAEACQSNGTCNNSVCQTMNCEEIYSCMIDCSDQGCAQDCLMAGTSQGQARFNALNACLYDHCSSVPDSQYQSCVAQYCQDEVDECMPIQTGNASCETVYNCMTDCGSNSTCQMDCYETGTAQAQATMDTMLGCFEDHCGSVPDSQWSTCVWTNCVNQVYACLPPADCDLTGGDCSSAAACYPVEGGHTDCFPTEGKALGQSCNPMADTLSCKDGLTCLSSGVTGTCMTTCLKQADCSGTDVCDFVYTIGETQLGVCRCQDQDGDGFCAGEDCDDNNANIKPGWVELCGDGKDNNCNGQVDENCATCTDRDDDGVCLEQDCNDDDSAIKPGATEVCDDEVDNDCDGQVDEGCGGCTDQDQDGYCADEDCNDQSASIKPGAMELCNDNVDNDCDGQVNEGCQGCTDQDGDGVCLDQDCNDEDPTIFPGNIERCGDGVDNNCNNAKDEGCSTCTDQDQDGYCTPADCDDQDPEVMPVGEEICFDGKDNNCSGSVNEGCSGCVDMDGDQFCDGGEDCDDFNSGVNPKAEELCDGRDNNCDGQVDEGCVEDLPDTVQEDTAPEPDTREQTSPDTDPIISPAGGGCSASGTSAGAWPLLLTLFVLFLAGNFRRVRLSFRN